MEKIVYVILILVSIDFFSFRPWIEWEKSNNIIVIIGFFLLCTSVFEMYNNRKRFLFKREIIFFLITFIFAAISSYILYHQSFVSSFKASMIYAYAAGLYFLAHKLKLSEEYLFQVLLYISLFFTAVEIIEQFTYPVYWFCGRIEKANREFVEKRMGLWRMYVFGIYYVLLSLMLVFQKLIDRREMLKNYILLAVLFVGVVFFVARKDIYASVSAMTIGLLFAKGKQSFVAKLILSVFLLVIFMIVPSMMEDLNAQTTIEFGDENFIRYVAARYFLFDMNSSPLYYLFGAGIPSGNSTLANLVASLRENYRYFQSDVGFIGYFSKVGFMGILSWMFIIVKIVKNYKYVDLSLLLYLLMMLELCFFDFFGQQIRNVSASFVYLYLVDCSIKRNRKKSKRSQLLIKINEYQWSLLKKKLNATNL